jgi:hypothetical protein
MGKFLGRFGVELRGVSVGELSGLFRHRAADFGNAVADGDDRSTTGSIEKALASRSEDKTSFAANGLRIRLQEISRKHGVAHDGFSISQRLYVLHNATRYFHYRPIWK